VHLHSTSVLCKVANSKPDHATHLVLAPGARVAESCSVLAVRQSESVHGRQRRGDLISVPEPSDERQYVSEESP